MGKANKKKRQSGDHCSKTVATNIVSPSVKDCTDITAVTSKHISKSRKHLKDIVTKDADTQLKENKPERIVSENGVKLAGAKKKSKKSHTHEVIGENTLATNETVAESNVGKSKKRKHENADLLVENSRQSDESKKSDNKIKKTKHETVVSSDAGSRGKKSKKNSQTVESLTTDTGKKTKPAPIRKTKKQVLVADSKTNEDEENDAGNVMLPDSTAKYHALEYLKRWKLQRSEWSFQKVRQVWLLQNMYDEKKVSSEDFNFMVEYLQDLAGKARQSTVDLAEKMMAEAEDEETSDGATLVSEEKFERLRRVIQILS